MSFGYLCPKCNHLHLSWSAGECEVADFINSLGIEVVRNTERIVQGVELDLFLPEYNIGIEFDGLYWHSEAVGKNKDYHLAKTINAADADVRLIHIFEDEWVKRKEIVKSRLRAILGKEEHRYQARKCQVAFIENGICNSFLDEYHLQGSCNASVKVGLTTEKNELVAVMTFAKPRFNKNYDWELVRYASKGRVVGGAGKLLAFFRKHYDGSIISYADKRWSNGGLYRSLGFMRLPDSAPSPSYFKKNTLDRINRVRFRKEFLKTDLETFDESDTAAENIRANGYLRIWDCGAMVFVDKL